MNSNGQISFEKRVDSNYIIENNFENNAPITKYERKCGIMFELKKFVANQFIFIHFY